MAGDPEPYPAMHWEPLDEDNVRCRLCPWRCVIGPDRLGRCCVRKNIAGKLYSLNYHRLCATNVDPIEKKPLFQFQPGSTSFSIACVGCNFQCDFCQNWQISQMPRDEKRIMGHAATPETIVAYARRSDCASISYTYTEPTIYYELAYETSKLAHDAGLKNVFVSNAYTSIEALAEIEPYLDGINVDLKSFREAFYRDRCRGHLEPVLESLRWLAKSRVWLEVTTLVIPDQNDSDEELTDIAGFIANDLGPDVPWHVSRYRPDYKYDKSPPTPLATIERALTIARHAGLRYVYGGNVTGHRSENTYCPKCTRCVIERTGFTVQKNLAENARCPNCQTHIAGVDL